VKGDTEGASIYRNPVGDGSLFEQANAVYTFHTLEKQPQKASSTFEAAPTIRLGS
jgi:hypothetical protein